MPRFRPRQLARTLTRALLLGVAVVLLLVLAVMAALQTGWGRDRLRALIVSQANRFLTATLEIGRLDGSLIRGIELTDIRLSREGEAIVEIGQVEVVYSIRELIEGGTVIRHLRVERPRVKMARGPDGRWNVAALVRREAREERREGPGRAIRIELIEVTDGTVTLDDPLAFGAARVPTRFEQLDAALAFSYRPVAWELDFASASFVGTAPDLTVTHLEGAIANGRPGWTFDDLRVETPQSTFTLAGRVDRQQQPTVLDLHVDADRFTFQEWAGIVGGLRNIAIEAGFDVKLQGPLAKLTTRLALESNGGDVAGELVLDTSARGWHGTGEVEVAAVDLSRWLNRPDRPSDITGRVSFDLDLNLGGRFPRGRYTFSGPHVRFLDYEADDVRARGTLTARDALIARATATAYGANVDVSTGSIGLDSPYPFTFDGRADGVDLRLLPDDVPVPHVESTLTFDYGVRGQFSNPFIEGRAVFDDSTFLGAAVEAGATGGVDTSQSPFRYNGEGVVRDLVLERFARDLEIGWLQDPSYAGIVDGRFRVQGTGADLESLVLTGGGRIESADLFGGRLFDGDVTIDIGAGSLRGSYAGAFASIDPAVVLDDARYQASLSGTGRGAIAVPELLVRTPGLEDYALTATIDFADSEAQGVRIDEGSLDVELSDGRLAVAEARVSGEMGEARGSGELVLDGEGESRFEYSVSRADLGLLAKRFGYDLAGMAATTGQLTGPLSSPTLSGTLVLNRLLTDGLQALSTTAAYTVAIPVGKPADATARLDIEAQFVELLGQSLLEITGPVTYDRRRMTVDLALVQADDRTGAITGEFDVDPEQQAIEIERLTFRLRDAVWRLAEAPARVAWSDDQITVGRLRLEDATSGAQRAVVDGTWRAGGGGALRVTAANVSIDQLLSASGAPADYGGRLELDATVSGNRTRPTVTGTFAITDGRVRKLSYERLAGRVDYADAQLQIDVRLDQAPGVWLTAAGYVPRALFDGDAPEAPIEVSVRSSRIALGLLEGLTDVVRDVSGTLEIDVQAVGSSADPHFTGIVDVADAGFVVNATGVRYQNGRASVQLTRDRVTVNAMRVEDTEGRVLEVRGGLGTHELKVGDLEIDASAKQFRVLGNEFGNVEVDARLSLRGRFESPRVTGTVTMTGGQVRVDTVLDRALTRPYSTEAQPETVAVLDPLRALNPWERLGLDLELAIPGTLRMVGENVQVAPGTPLGVSNINLRVVGALYLYKDPAQPLYVTGSLDRLTGAFAFQGRGFDLDPNSSINFRGDLNPELYVMVERVISGVQTRITIAGPLQEPELRLASTPPLEASDILSLIVFNTTTNQLNAEQQEQLAVRGVTLAAGFLATPLVTALERSLGIDTLEIEPTTTSGGARVTIGDEIAPGLVARFSRQFGPEEYDEATLEYYLSRIFRIRATFSDASALSTRSPFRRVERAGIDLLLFFSF